jgi:hypothetical protein
MPHDCTPSSASSADKPWLEIRQPNIIGPLVGDHLDPVRAFEKSEQ